MVNVPPENESPEEFKEIEALPDSKQILREKFGDLIAVDKRTITIFNRESTAKGSPINKSFNLNFDSIAQAVLKVNLLADQGRILQFIPNEFNLQEINVNGFRFTPSDARSSVNVIERLNDSVLNKILIPKGENQISISFNAPIGAGVLSPNAEITAILTVNGSESPFAITDISTTQITKDIQTFIADRTPLVVALAVLLVIGLIAVAIIATRASQTTKSIEKVVE